MNGSGHIADTVNFEHDTGPNVISVNAGLTKRDLVAAGGMLFAAVSSLIAGGYLFLPARQSDMSQVQSTVTELRRDVGELKTATGQLTTALGELHTAISALEVSVDRSRRASAVRPRAKVSSR
jgi:septal ring factor EnvC (AmiA/AmiB activator)